MTATKNGESPREMTGNNFAQDDSEQMWKWVASALNEFESEIKNANFDLCEAFNGISACLEDAGFEDACQDAEIVTQINDRLTQLYSDCSRSSSRIDEYIELYRNHSLSLGDLDRGIKDHEQRLLELMTTYKGLYDMILLERSTQQVSVDNMDALRSCLAKPFECHQCIQRALGPLMARLEGGLIETCLRKLEEQCEELKTAIATRHAELLECRDAYSEPPSEATDFEDKLENIPELTTLCGKIPSPTTQEDDQLKKDLEDVSTYVTALQNRAIDLSIELREDVGPKLPWSWPGRASWLACAKQLLWKLHQGSADLSRQVRECLAQAGQERQPDHPIAEAVTQAPPQARYPTGTTPGSTQVADPWAIALNNAVYNLNANTEHIATHMLLQGSTSPAGGGLNGTAAEAKVANAIQVALGTPVGGDPRSFYAALKASYPEDTETGKIVREPVRTVVSLDVGSGQLAASQGVLGHEVQLVVNDALKILEGLRSIGPDTDDERAVALKEIVHSELSSLITEAGRVDRPRRSKTDAAFEGLLGSPTALGYLTQLRTELGLDSGDVLGNPELVTPEEAQLMASMDLLDQYVAAVKSAYDTFYASEAGQDPRDGSYSGRLAFVNTLFSVVAASVREVEASMDAVELSAAERRITFIDDPNAPGNLISIDGILSWVKDLAQVEGPALIAGSGLIGLTRVLAIVDSIDGPLFKLVEELKLISEGMSTINPAPVPHPGLGHPRVRYSLRQLYEQFTQFTP